MPEDPPAPPPPAPRHFTIEELEARREANRPKWWQTRRFRISVISALAILLLIYAGPKIGRRIKALQSRRLAYQATELMNHGHVAEAAAKARDALQIDSREVAGWRAVARLLTETGRYRDSLQWWERIVKREPVAPEDRREYGTAAIANGDLNTASSQVEALLKQPKPVAADWLLAAQVAARRQDGERALDATHRVLADVRSQPNEMFAAAVLILSFTTTDSPPHVAAWQKINDLATDAKNPSSLQALTFLAQQQRLAPAAPAPNAASRLSLSDLADKLEHHPQAKPFHQLLALQTRALQEPKRIDEYANQAVQRFGHNDDESFGTLVQWLLALRRFDTVLQLLPLERITPQPQLLLVRLEALQGLGRWNEIKDILSSDRYPIDVMTRHIYLAVANGKLAQPTACANEWQRALESADNAEKQLTLANAAAQAGVFDIADAAYARAIAIQPQMRTAYDGRLELALHRGDTARAQGIVADMLKVWPKEISIRQRDLYLKLLHGASPEEAANAERDAQEFVKVQPMSWDARKVLALARLREGRPRAALETFRGLTATGNPDETPPGALAVRARALADSGLKDPARSDAHNLASQPLLPEERALIADLIAP